MEICAQRESQEKSPAPQRPDLILGVKRAILTCVKPHNEAQPTGSASGLRQTRGVKIPHGFPARFPGFWEGKGKMWRGIEAVITGLTRNRETNLESDDGEILTDQGFAALHRQPVFICSLLPFSPKYWAARRKIYTERYRSGHNGADSKSVCRKRHMGSNPILSATLG